jgi:hypothetical protein
MPFETITSIAVAQRIAERRRDLIAYGKATAGGSTSLTDAGELSFDDANALVGAWIYIWAGTSAGDERRITASTTVGVVTVAAWSSTPSTDSEYIITRTRRPTEYKRMVLDGLRASRRAQLSYRTVRNILTGCPSELDCLFNYWDSETSLTGGSSTWAVTGASGNDSTREFAAKVRGDYSVKWLIDASTAGTFVTPAADLWWQGIDAGDSITVEALVYAVGTRGATLTWTETGSDFTISNAGTHGGKGWEVIKCDIAVATDQTDLPDGTFGLSMPSNSGAVEVIVDHIFIPTSNQQRRYFIPKEFSIIDEIRVDLGEPGSSDGSVNDEIMSSEYVIGEDVRIIRGTNAPTTPSWLPTAERGNHQLEFIKRPPDNRVIEISGLGLDTNMREGQLADAENMFINAEILIEYGKWRMDQDQDAASNYFRMLEGTRVPYPENSLSLENL